MDSRKVLPLGKTRKLPKDAKYYVFGPAYIPIITEVSHVQKY